MRTIRWARSTSVALASIALTCAAHSQTATIQGQSLTATADPDGTYTLSTKASSAPILSSSVEASVNDELLNSSAYPQHKTTESAFHDEFVIWV